MPSKKISILMAFAFLLAAPMALLGQKENPEPSLLLRQQVDLEVTNLARNLQLTQEPAIKIKLIQKSRLVVDRLRQQNAEQLEADETYLDAVQDGLESLSRPQEFSKNFCELQMLRAQKQELGKIEYVIEGLCADTAAE